MAVSNIMTPQDIQGYQNRLKNTPADPLTALKNGGSANFMQNQPMKGTYNPTFQNPSIFDWSKTYAQSNPQTDPLGNIKKNIGQALNFGANIGSGISSAFNPSTGGLPGLLGRTFAPTVNAQTTSASTPLKKTTTTDSAGNSVVNEYHAPQQPAAQASYTGGTTGTPVPALGTPEYVAAQKMVQPAQNPIQNQNTTQTNASQQNTQNTQQTSNTGIPGAFSTFLGGLGNIGFGGSPQVNKAAQDLATFRQQYANTLADVQGDPNLSLDTKTGIGQIIGNRAAEQESALSGALQAALSGQGQQIGALQSGATATAPVSQFGVLTSPVTGQPISPGMTPGSAAFQGGFIGGQQAAGSSAAQMSVANTAAKGIEGTIQQFLQANPNLNPSPVAAGNAFLQFLQGKQLGDPQYQTLVNYLNEYVSTLAPILGVGGDPTNFKTQIAQSMINAQAQGQSISQVLSGISKLADDKLANIISAGQGGGQVAGPTPQGSTPTSFGTEW